MLRKVQRLQIGDEIWSLTIEAWFAACTRWQLGWYRHGLVFRELVTEAQLRSPPDLRTSWTRNCRNRVVADCDWKKKKDKWWIVIGCNDDKMNSVYKANLREKRLRRKNHRRLTAAQTLLVSLFRFAIGTWQNVKPARLPPIPGENGLGRT